MDGVSSCDITVADAEGRMDLRALLRRRDVEAERLRLRVDCATRAAGGGTSTARVGSAGVARDGARWGAGV